MADHAKDQEQLMAEDPEFHTGAVEPQPESSQQILPVWASSEPFGYQGSAVDAQFVGGGGGGGGDREASEAKADRDIIGPETG